MENETEGPEFVMANSDDESDVSSIYINTIVVMVLSKINIFM